MTFVRRDIYINRIWFMNVRFPVGIISPDGEVKD